MADEQTIDVTNSEAEATPTGDAATPDQNTSATPTDAPEADPLDGGSVLGDATDPKPSDAEGGDPDTGGEGDAPKDGEAEPLTGAPEGDYELALPEGVTLDKAALEAVAPIAKELNLSNAGLSKLAGVYAEHVLPGAMKQVEDNMTSQIVAQRAAWDQATRLMIAGGKDADGNDVQPDPTFRGKTLEQVQAVAAKALDRFGGSGVREFLTETGLGNDPRLVTFAFKAGDAISEDSDFVRPGNVPTAAKSREEKYYPNMAGS